MFFNALHVSRPHLAFSISKTAKVLKYLSQKHITVFTAEIYYLRKNKKTTKSFLKLLSNCSKKDNIIYQLFNVTECQPWVHEV